MENLKKMDKIENFNMIGLKDYRISFLRFCSMISIILCHIFQYLNNGLAWWLNVGVQIFLLLSGLLYGEKKIQSSWEFLKKNLVKILVDYYILLILGIPLFCYFANIQFSLVEVLKMFLMLEYPSGWGHLWFIRYIVLCYCITPLLSKISKENIKIYISVIVAVQILSLSISIFEGAWINCYIIGFFLGKHHIIRDRRAVDKAGRIIVPSAIFLNVFKILTDILNIDFIGEKYYKQYSHCLLALLIVILVIKDYNILNRTLKNRYLLSILNYSDKYSYDIYLVHQLFILGPLSIFTDFRGVLSIVKGVILIILFSGALFFSSSMVKNHVFKRICTH